MKPILFNTEMVKAILDGRKTVTRRVLEEKERLDKKHGLDREPYKDRTGEWCVDKQTDVDDYRTCVLKPRYQPGDILYVRETWAPLYQDKDSKDVRGYMYKACTLEEYDKMYPDGKDYQWEGKWRPSIHMPKEAARIFLRVTDVRVERLQDITSGQIDAEGCKEWAYSANTGELLPSGPLFFRIKWDRTIKPADLPFYGWEANPWVWVIEFERISREEAMSEEHHVD